MGAFLSGRPEITMGAILSGRPEIPIGAILSGRPEIFRQPIIIERFPDRIHFRGYFNSHPPLPDRNTLDVKINSNLHRYLVYDNVKYNSTHCLLNASIKIDIK